MLRRNKKLFSLIVAATLLTSYTTSSILPTVVLAKEAYEKTESKEKNNIVKDEIVKSLENLERKEKDWSTLTEENKKFTKFSLNLTEENFYSKIENNNPNEIAIKLLAKLKSKFTIDDKNLLSSTEAEGRINEIILFTHNDLKDINETLKNSLLEIIGLNFDISFEAISSIGNSEDKVEIDTSKVENEILLKTTKGYGYLGDKLPNEESSLNELNLDLIQTFSTFNFDIDSSKILAFYINDTEFKVDNSINFNKFKVDLSKIEPSKDETYNIKLIAAPSTDDSKNLFTEVNAKLSFEKNIKKDFKIKASNLNLLKGNDGNLNLTMDAPTNPLLFNKTLLAEVTYLNRKLSTDIIPFIFDEKTGNFSLSQEISKDKVIKNIKLYYYDDNISIQSIDANLPVYFNSNTIDTKDLIIIDDNIHLKLAPLDLNENYSEHYLVAINDLADKEEINENSIKLEKDSCLNLEKLINLGFKIEDEDSIFFVKSIDSENNSTISSYYLKKDDSAFSSSVTDSLGNTLINNGNAKINSNNFTITLDSTLNLKTALAKINNKNVNLDIDKNKATLKITPELFVENGNNPLEITLTSLAGDSTTLKFNYVLDTTAPTISIDKNYKDIIFKDDIYYLPKDRNEIKFNVTDELSGESLTLGKEKVENGSITLKDGILTATLNEDSSLANFNIQILDGLSNSVDLKFSLLKEDINPEMKVNFKENSVLQTTNPNGDILLYVNKDIKDLEFDVEVTDENLDFDSINYQLGESTIPKESINITKGNSRATENKTLSVKIADIPDESKTELIVIAKDYCGNETSQKFILIKNEKPASNPSSSYGSDKILVYLEGNSEKTNYSNYFHNFPSILNPLGTENSNILQISDKLINDTLKFRIEKNINPEIEKVSIDYKIENKNLKKPLTGSLDFDNSTPMEHSVELPYGETTLTYTINSTNGSSTTNTLIVQYDDKPILLDINIPKNNTNETIIPNIKIHDMHLPELESLSVTHKFNDISKDYLLSKEELEKHMKISDELVLYDLIGSSALLSGKHEFSIKAKSNFGYRKNIELDSIHNFWVDTESPVISDKASNIDDYKFKNNIYYLKNGKAKLEFNLTDNLDLSQLELLSQNNENGATVSIDSANNKLVIENIPDNTLSNNEVHNFNIKIKDIGDNIISKEIKIVKDNLAPSLEFLPFDEKEVTLFENSNVYLKANSKKLTVKAKISDNLTIPKDEIKASLHLSDSEIIEIPVSNKRYVSDVLEFDIPISKLPELSSTKLTFDIKDENGNTTNGTLNLIRNNNVLENDSFYGTDRFSLALTGTDSDNAELYSNKDFSAFSADEKPLSSIDGYMESLQLTNALKDNKLILKFNKLIPENLLSFEKLNLTYSVENANKLITSGSLEFLDNATSKDVEITLAPGLNKINYIIKSSNGLEISKELFIYYDYAGITIETNLKTENNINYLKPDGLKIKIIDDQISELDSVSITGTFIDPITSKTHEINETISIKDLKIDEESDILTYLINDWNFKEGNYSNIKIKVNSNFGLNRTTDFSKVLNFIIDDTAPTIGDTALNNTDLIEKDDYLYLKSNVNEVLFPVTDNNDLKNLSIHSVKDINGNSFDKVTAELTDGVLKLSNIKENENLEFIVEIKDSSNNSTSKTFKFVKDTSPLTINTTFKEGVFIPTDDIAKNNNLSLSNEIVYIQKDVSAICFDLYLEDNYFIDENSINVKFLEKDSPSEENKPKITVNKIETKASLENHYAISIENIENLSFETLSITANDMVGNTTNKKFDLVRNNESLTTNHDIYKTNRISIYLGGKKETTNKDFFMDLNDFSDDDRELSSSDKRSPNLQLTEKLVNDQLTINLNKLFPNGTDAEKTKINYVIESAGSKITDTIGFFAPSNSNSHSVTLKKGTNKISYEIISSNGDKMNHSINIYYDPEAIELTTNFDKNSHFKNLTPEIKISDKNIDEISTVTIKYKYNDQSTEDANKNILTYSRKDLEAYKTGSDYLIKLDALKEGSYKDFSVEVTSIFGKRRKTNFKVSNSFIIDRTAPSLETSIFSKNNNNSEILLTNDSYHNIGESTSPITILIAEESLDSFNAAIETKNIKASINDYDSSNFELTKLDKKTFNGKNYHAYSISSKNSDLNITAEGTYSLKLNVKDAAENISNYETTYTIDKTNPEISGKTFDRNSENTEVNLPIGDAGDKVYLNTNKATLEFNDKFLASNTLEVFLNDKSIFNSTNSNADRNIDLNSEGSYKFVVTAEDKAKNKTSKIYKLKVDTKAPVINSSFFNSNPLFTTNSPKINLAVSHNESLTGNEIFIKDTMQSVDKIEVSIKEKVTGKTYPTQTFSNVSEGSIYKLLTNCPEGNYEISLTAVDKARNKSNVDSSTFVIDTNKPKINISADSIGANFSGEGIFDGKHHSVSSTKPVITIDDITTTAGDLKFYLNNQEIKPVSINTDIPYKLIATLPNISSESIYNLKVVANDRVVREFNNNKNQSNSELNFALDRTAPNIKVNLGNKLAIANTMNYLTNNTSKIVAETIDNLSKLEDIKVNVTVKRSDSIFNSTTLSYDDVYNITVTAEDKAGNTSRFDTIVTVDTKFPEIVIDGVKDKHYYNTNITPTWKIDDETATTTITLNGVPFTNSSQLSAEGNYKLVITSVDVAGNRSEMILNFVIDKTAPVIKISGIENNGVYTSAVNPKIFLDDPDSILNVLLNNIEYMGHELNKDGSYTLYVKAVDKAGNATELTYKFRLNVSAPIVELNGLTHGETYTGPIKLDFKFTDAVSYKVFVNGKPYNGEELTEDGTYNVQVIAIDEDGNETEENYTFYLKNSNTDKVATIDNNKENLPLFFSISGLLVILLLLIFFIKRKRGARYHYDVDENNDKNNK